MATAPALSEGLRQKLHATAGRIRLHRLLQGASLVVLALALPAAAGLLLEWLADGLAPLTRGLFLAGWALLAAGVAVRYLLLPLVRPLDPTALAALVEEQHPELAERLTSSVELADHADLHHGSPGLIALLLEETEKQTQQISFAAVVSPRRSRDLGLTLAAILVLVATPAVVWPGEVEGLARRFFLSWSGTRFRLEAAEGDRIAAQGRPLTFTAHADLEPGQKPDALPDSATLVLVSEARETRLPMLREGPGQFTLKLDRLPAGGSYHIEAGEVRSARHTLTAVVPVELAAESPTITATPPAYARDLVLAQTTQGLAGVSVLQHGAVRFDFRFTRPAVRARLELTGGEGEKRQSEVVELTLSADRLGATFERRVGGEFDYRLVLEAEHGITTEHAAQTVTARLDQPPAIKNFVLARKDSRPVHPSDRVGFSFDVFDDLAVEKAEIELRLNDVKAKSQFLPIPLTGAGSPEAGARHHLLLAGKVKPGDRVYYRVRAQDNRSVPDAKPPLTPQVVYHPAEDWLTLTVAADAAPSAQRDIQAEHDTLNKKIEQIKADLNKEVGQVQQLQQALRNQRELTPEQAQQLQDLQGMTRTSEENLVDLARDFENTPELRPLTEGLRDVARQEVKQAEKALEQAEKKPSERGKQLDVGQRQLTEAVKRLGDLQKISRQLAKDRLDQMKLEQLAEREKTLAEQLARMQEKGEPDQKELKQLQQEQAKVAAELQQLVQQNENLKNALDALRSEQARELAEKARELADKQREVASEMAERERQARVERLAELAKKQEELNRQAQRLAEDTKQAARVAQKAPLNTEEAKKALEALKQGEAEQAMRRQHQSALELDRLAADLDRASRAAQDPKEAAKQLARWQEAIKERLNQEATKKDADRPTAERLRALEKEQKGLKQAAEQLSVPPGNEQARQDQKEAAREADRATEALDRQDVSEAARHMEKAREALEKLSRDLPDLESRKREALAELNRLTRQQEQVGRQAAEASKKLAEAGDDKQKQQAARQDLEKAAKKQAAVAEQLSKLDTPRQEAQKEKAEASQQQALADLLDGKKQDVPASQERAQRDLERLKDALEGQKTPEQTAAELAKKQADLTQQAKNPGATPEQKQAQARQQQEVARQTEKIDAPEAAQAKQEAAEATRKAAEAAQKDPGGAEAQEQMEKATKALEKLAREMSKPSGAEPGESPQKQAQQAAERQKQLAQATAQAQQEAQKQPGAEGQKSLEKALGKLAQEQKALNEQTSKLPAPGAQKALEEARSAMNRAQQALENRDAGEAQKQQQAAAQALEKLAQQAPTEAPQQAAKPQQPPSGTPSQEQADEARKLAQAQRQLRQALEDVNRPGPTPGDLARQQQQIGQQAQQMAQKLGPQQGQQAQQAAQKAQQAAQQLQQGNPTGAKGLGEEVAQAMQKLAQALGEKPGDPLGEQARQLAQQQQALNEKMQGQSPQQGLQQETGDLAKQLQKLAQESPGSQPLQQAAQQAQQAQQAMKQAQQQSQQGNSQSSQKSQQMAAQSLDQAAKSLASMQQGQQAMQPTGQPLRQGQQAMQQAQQAMQQGQSQQAQQAMQQSAQSLAQAAQQWSEQQQKGMPNGQPPANQRPTVGSAGGGEVDASSLPPELRPFAGMRWGEVPGEKRAELMQAMQKQYGDDYARRIKLYFEQLADRKQK